MYTGVGRFIFLIPEHCLLDQTSCTIYFYVFFSFFFPPYCAIIYHENHKSVAGFCLNFLPTRSPARNPNCDPWSSNTMLFAFGAAKLEAESRASSLPAGESATGTSNLNTVCSFGISITLISPNNPSKKKITAQAPKPFRTSFSVMI